MTIAEAIQKAAVRLSDHGVPNAPFDAELLLRRVLDRDRAWIIAHGRERLDEERRTAFEAWIARRAKREPLQYITGRQEFWGLDFFVTPDVLIPRPETELVVEAAIRRAGKTSGLTVIDLCTGSGCIAVSLAKGLPAVRIFATDKSAKALVVARENARRHSVSDRIKFLEGDLLEPLAELDVRGRVDVITANPPYVPSGYLPALQPEVREFEPELALIAGPEGTEIEERIISSAPEILKKGGSLIMEMGLGQTDALKKILAADGRYCDIDILKDLAGIDRVMVTHRR